MHAAPPSQRRDQLAGTLSTSFRAGLGLLLILISSGFAFLLYRTRPTPPKVDREALLRSVPVIELTPVEAPRIWLAFGTAQAKRTSEVAAEVSGLIVERPEEVEPGLTIASGDLLVRLEADEYSDLVAQSKGRLQALEADLQGLTTELESLQESLQFAQQAVELTESELRRFAEARDVAGINEIEIERLTRQLTEVRRQREELRRLVDLIPTRRLRLEAQRTQEQAGLRLAELNLRRTRILAPLTGVLQRVDVEEGERVAPGTPIARIVDLSRVEIPVRAPLSAASTLRVGDVARMESGAPGSPVWIGEIERIAPEADQSTRTITVFVLVEQDPDAAHGALLLPGQYVNASLRSSEPSPVIAVPRSSVQDDRLVLIDEDGTARFTDVETVYTLEGTYPSLHPTETQWLVVRPVDPRVHLADALLMAAAPDSVLPGESLDPVRVDASGAGSSAPTAFRRGDPS